MKPVREVVEWDEWLQGYDSEGRLVVCICGASMDDWSDHYCPYDAEPDEVDPINRIFERE